MSGGPKVPEVQQLEAVTFPCPSQQVLLKGGAEKRSSEAASLRNINLLNLPDEDAYSLQCLHNNEVS